MFGSLSFHQKFFSIVFVIAPIVKVAIQIQKSRDRDAYHKSANALKLILLLGLIYLLMFSPCLYPMELLK